jgi:MSHA biogenesis protein MshE
MVMNPRAAHFGAEEVDLKLVSYTAELLACVPAEAARRFRVLPVFNSRAKLKLALADPADLDTIDTLQKLLQRNLELCVAEANQLNEFIDRLYGREGAV